MIVCARIAVVLILVLMGCESVPVSVKPALVSEGEIFIYLMPFPREAERLSFHIESVSVTDDEGREFPLNLSLSQLGPEETRRQRLLASGIVPRGMYKRLVFTVGKGSLASGDKEVDLIIPETTVSADVPLTVVQRQAKVIWVTFRYDKSFPSPASFRPVFEAAIPERQPMGVMGFVVNRKSNTITVFDKQRLEVTDAISTDISPRGAVTDLLLGRLYVALEAAIEVFDAQSWNVITMIDIGRGDNIGDLALTPDRRTLLSVNTDSATVSLIDTSSLFETATIPVGQEPSSLLLDPSGTRAFVFNKYSDTISVIDLGSQKVAGTIATESRPFRGQFNRNGDRLYVVHEGSPYVVIIDPRSLTVAERHYIGMGITAFKVDTRTGLLYVGTSFESRVAVYDPVSFVPIDSIETPGPVSYMTIDGEENALYMVIPSKNMVSIASLVSKRTISEIDTGEGPYRVTFNGER